MENSIEQLRDEVNFLHKLLQDAHPGLAIWQLVLGSKMERVRANIEEIQGELPAIKVKALGLVINFIAGALQEETAQKKNVDKIWKIIEIAKKIKQATDRGAIVQALDELQK